MDTDVTMCVSARALLASPYSDTPLHTHTMYKEEIIIKKRSKPADGGMSGAAWWVHTQIS